MGSCMSSSLSEGRRRRRRKLPTYETATVDSQKGRSRRKSNRGGTEIGGGAAVRDGDGNRMMSEEELLGVPGRMFGNGSSERACLFTQQGRKGTNQDAMLVWEDFASRDDTIFCGVFDGHGPYGHLVARKVRDSLPLKLCKQWKAITNDGISSLQNGSFEGSTNSEENASVSIDEEWFESIDIYDSEKIPEVYLAFRPALLKAFKLMDKELKLHETTDCFCSGTTAVTMIKQGQDLVIGNVGDSRAVLGTRVGDNSLVAIQLTVDLKPNLPREAARIQQCKGRVFALQDEPDVARVWLPNSDSPGLAMARAFGDFCLKDYGLISVPDITYRRLTDRDEFIVLATDGVWDVFSNKEVVDIVASAPSHATAARALVDCAVRAWRLKFPTSKSDDCAVVCLFLNASSSSDHDHETSQMMPDGPVLTTLLGSNNEQTINAEEHHHPSLPNHSQLHNSPIEHPCVPSSPAEIVPVPEAKDDKLHERTQSTRSLADFLSTTEEEEWSALEGVTRVNSLLNIPRFLSGDKGSTSWRKW